jgi:hypothetical protein
LSQRNVLFTSLESSIGLRTVLVRRYGIVDEIKKNIEADEQLKEAREALKKVFCCVFGFFFFFYCFFFRLIKIICFKEQEDEYDLPEYHQEVKGTHLQCWEKQSQRMAEKTFGSFFFFLLLFVLTLGNAIQPMERLFYESLDCA